MNKVVERLNRQHKCYCYICRAKAGDKSVICRRCGATLTVLDKKICAVCANKEAR